MIVKPILLDGLPYSSPVTNITPFTVRDGTTYLIILEELRTWLREYLVPTVNEGFEAVDSGTTEAIDTLIEDVNSALTAQSTDINTALAAQVANVANMLSSQNALVSDQLAVIAGQVNQWMATQITNNDAITKAILSDPLSETNAAIVERVESTTKRLAKPIVNYATNPSFDDPAAVGDAVVGGVFSRQARDPAATFTTAANVGVITAEGTSTLMNSLTAIGSFYPIRPGQVVMFSQRIAADADLRVASRVFWINSAGASIGTAAASTYRPSSLTATASRHVAIGTAPEGAVAFRVGAYAQHVTTGTVIPAGKRMLYTRRFITVSDTQADANALATIAYGDGSTVGWEWMGTAFASASRMLPVTPETTYGNITIYTSKANGVDTNSGAIDRPVKTLAQAVRMIPSIIRLGHTVNVYVDGVDWDETLRHENIIIGGALRFIGQGATLDFTNPNAVISPSARLNQVIGKNMIGRLEHINLAVKERANGAQFWYENCTLAFATGCEAMGDPSSNVTGAGRIGFLADLSTHLVARGCRATYKRYMFRSNYVSRIFAIDNSPGLDANGQPTNNFGAAARWGGLINLHGTEPRGIVTDHSVDSGGIIVAGYGIRKDLNYDERAIVDQWQTTNSPASRKFYSFRNRDIQYFTQFTPSDRVRITYDGLGLSGMVTVDVEFSARIDDANTIYQHKRYVGSLNATAFFPTASRTIMEAMPSGYAGTAANIITVVNRGNGPGQFWVTVAPQIATLDDWSIDITVTRGGLNEAPRAILWGLA